MNQIKLLFVEDETTLAKIIKETLQKRNFEVLLANNGKEGLEAYRMFKPDIIVADIMMPEMDGLHMVQTIRQENKIIPIIFLSAKSETKDIIEGFETGGNDYLKKPFSIEELIIRIQSLLNRIEVAKPQAKKRLYNIGEYSFDPIAQQLTHPLRSYSLSHRESAILEHLCSNLNQIIEHKTILLDLWGDDDFFNTRSLQVFIVKLRKKLSLDPHIQIINIRGVGYKLID